MENEKESEKDRDVEGEREEENKRTYYSEYGVDCLIILCI